MRLLVVPVVVVVVASGASVGWADKVVKKDGTEVSGVIVSETATTVVIQVSRGGAVMKYPIERSAIAAVERGVATQLATKPATQPVEPGPSGPGYYALPIGGQIGVDVTAGTLREALGEARRVSPAVVVIVFDTEGGDLAQAREMVEVLRQQPQELRIVAYVRKALSGGAVVAMGCREIYMAGNGVIGAGAAEDATAKTAAITGARVAAEQGGHPGLVAEGMFDPDVELIVGTVDGKARVFVAGEAAEVREAKVLKGKGRLLTLSGAEAVACGLARGTLDSLENLHGVLGMSEPLHKMASTGAYLIERKGRAAREEMARQAFIAERKKAYDAYMERVGPEIERIDARLEEIKPEVRAAQDTLRDLDGQWNADTRAIEDEYRAASRVDAAVRPERRAQMLDRAKARREEKLSSARERFQPQVIEKRERINELTREQQGLVKKRKGLVDGAPKVPR